MSKPTLNGQDVVALVSARAAADPVFAKELLAAPQAAVEKLMNTKLPPNHSVVAVEQPANTWVVVVPTGGPVGADGELSDADLEVVAGGSKSAVNDFFNDVGDFFVENGSAIAADVAGVALTGVGARNAGGAASGAINSAC